jgi:hypothetical protein
MKKLLNLLVLTLLLQPLFANSSLATKESEAKGNTYFQLIKTKSEKINLKERLLIKFAERKVRKQINEDEQTKNIKLLGIFSLWSGLLGVISWLAAIGTSWAATQFLLVMILVLFPLALILGLISLIKRKKLSDKKAVSKIPALLGAIIGSAGVLLILIGLIIVVTSFGF